MDWRRFGGQLWGWLQVAFLLAAVLLAILMVLQLTQFRALMWRSRRDRQGIEMHVRPPAPAVALASRADRAPPPAPLATGARIGDASRNA